MALPQPLQHLRRKTGPLIFAWMATLAVVHLVFLVAVGAFGSSAAAGLYYRWLALSPGNLLAGRLWTLLSYATLHDLDSLFHVLGNLLGLYFFGPAAERALGRRGLIRMAVLAVVCGGLAQVGWQLAVGRDAPIVGVSAAVMALMATFAWQQPHAKILLFFALPIEAQYFVPIVLGIDVLSALSGTPVAVAAHAAGVAVAWFLVQAGGSPRVAWIRLRALFQRLTGKESSGGKRTGGATIYDIGKGRRGPWDVN